MSIGSLWKEFDTWWDGTAIGEEINAAAASALAELEAVAPDVLKVVTSSTATAILTGLAASNPTSAIIAAGIEAAEASLDEWRKGLGERLDQQDAAMSVLKGYGVKIFGWLLFGIISVLGTVTGLWLHSVGIIK